MWPYLKWHHGITGYFTGDTFHIADEGHADYTFLGCGGRAFQIQLEAPPYQFKYEQDWYAKFGNGYNHICWIVSDARKAYEQLQADGATVMQEFQPFPTYDGFVMADPEGRWIEIMEYTHDVFRVQEFTHQPAGECGLRMIGFLEVVNDLEAMSQWYQRALDMRVLRSGGNGAGGFVELSDKFHDADERNTLMILTDAETDEQKAVLSDKGPHISAIIYEAGDIERAYEDAVWAGMEAVSAPSEDELAGVPSAWVREPSGNLILLRAAS
jgi:catechol 2,3-dioxygenase-like lactoylglutathione lyase family enzyme